MPAGNRNRNQGRNPNHNRNNSHNQRPAEVITATAPYTFVPLPETIYTVSKGISVNDQNIKPWEMHDQYVPGTYNGWIELSIRTLTPLFIRGPVTKRDGKTWDNREARRRPEPCKTPDGKPMIPGSSLRGMIRTLVEIMSSSKIQPVTDEKPFFRDMSPRSQIYKQHFIEDKGEITSGFDITSDQQPVQIQAMCYKSKVRTGFVKHSAGKWVIEECDSARIEQRIINTVFHSNSIMAGNGPNAVPKWEMQNKKIFVNADPVEKDYFFRQQLFDNGNPRHRNMYLRLRKVHAASVNNQSGRQEARLVITGGIKYKHYEFAFITGKPKNNIHIPPAMWDRFHDEDQITQWQEKAFPKDKPCQNCRKVDGHLREGEPIFFLQDNSLETIDNPQGLVFFGRAQMFRFPYDKTPWDLVPDGIKNAELDLAEVMFGKVGKGKGKEKTIKSRLYFEDAIVTSEDQETTINNRWFGEVIVPQILASPKVTCVKHYLCQNDPQNIKTYLSNDNARIRGHKLYWHRWDRNQGVTLVKIQINHDQIRAALTTDGAANQHSQNTIIQPVNDKVDFEGRIRFDNLTELELGALLAAVQLPNPCAHKLGMGKPLGLGSIRITSKLCLINRDERYKSWKEKGLEEKDYNQYIESFKQAIKNVCPNHQSRLGQLCQILDWDNKPPITATQYMALANFRNGGILPSPKEVFNSSQRRT